MGFYLIGPLVTLISLGSISSWAFKLYCDDGLLGISPTPRSFALLTAATTSTASLPQRPLRRRLRGHPQVRGCGDGQRVGVVYVF
jgi:hypothetical protein